MQVEQEPVERHTLAILVDNEAGILARIAGLFSARGYNIESLTVAETSVDHTVSRITVVTRASKRALEQIVAQVERLVPVHRVVDLTARGPHVERELALVKLAGVGEQRGEAMRMAEAYRARVLDATVGSFVFEVTGSPQKIDSFIEVTRELGVVEVARTGVAALGRGRTTM
jgi:acetolactate synthase-1/3 small subunit